MTVPAVPPTGMIVDARRPALRMERAGGACRATPCTRADYPAERSIRFPVPRWNDVLGADVRLNRTRAAPPRAHSRNAETRVRRAPRFALQPRSIRSGGHSPIGRQAMNRPPPDERSMSARSEEKEGSMVTVETFLEAGRFHESASGTRTPCPSRGVLCSAKPQILTSSPSRPLALSLLTARGAARNFHWMSEGSPSRPRPVMTRPRTDALRGSLDLLVRKSLSLQPMHRRSARELTDASSVVPSHLPLHRLTAGDVP